MFTATDAAQFETVNALLDLTARGSLVFILIGWAIAVCFTIIRHKGPR